MRWIALLLLLPLGSMQAVPLPGTPALGIFHPETIRTVKGEIVRMERIRGAGVHLILQTAEGELDVHLGPSWYMEGKGIAFRCGESLSVTGSQVKSEGTEVIIATEIQQAEHTILIRHQSGIPLWSRS